MILIDTSAWIEFLRDTQSPACLKVDGVLTGDVATADPIRMEVLAGARSEEHLADLRRLLARATVLPTTAQHYDAAAALYRSARVQGLTIRRLMDCLIAAIAIDHDVPVLHADHDFDALSTVSALRVQD
jgi:predicted nucleic acid-binding protein